MLISFSVSNFRSFGEEVTLNMVASNKLADHPEHLVPMGDTGKNVLRAAVIFGANAAGKSNLVKAMAAAQRLILNRGDQISLVIPFRFRSDLEKKPTSFEFRFLISDRVFIYGFDIQMNRITSEWLTVLKGSEEIDLFQRDENGNTTVHDKAQKLFPDDDTTFKTLEALNLLQVRENQLFLNRAIELPEKAQGATLNSIIKWFSDNLTVVSADSRDHQILDRLHLDAGFKEFCGKLLDRFGTGVSALDIQESEQDLGNGAGEVLAKVLNTTRPLNSGVSDVRRKPENADRVIFRKLMAQHAAKSGTYQLPFSDESDGTQALLHLMPAIASPPTQSRIFVIDELDRSLHPKICWEFIKFFSETFPGARKQLIVTTHEVHLLDQELLRRDEYWFVEKDDSQQTRLTSLSDFNIRNDLQLQKGYLNGRFGGIPIIGGMDQLEKLLETPGVGEQADAANTAPA